MSHKNQIDSVYQPEKIQLKQKVIVGISGGIDSLVAAYLLKIQKFDLFAVTVLPSFDQIKGDKSGLLSCSIDESQLQLITDFCQQLKIPLEVVKLTSEFQAKIVEKWVSSKLTGVISNACWDCHGLRMKVLYEKMLEFKAQFIATGHFAKIFHHSLHDTYYVHSSNDEQNDQSGLLSRLPDQILRSLILPLSDLQKKEVLKLAENFGLNFKSKQIQMHQCFPTNSLTVEYLKATTPKNFYAKGEMMNEDSSVMFGEHEGVINMDMGKVFTLEGAVRKQDLYFVNYLFKERKVILSGEGYFNRDSAILIDCHFSKEVSWVAPMKAYAHLEGDQFIDCWIYPKCLNSAFFVLLKSEKILQNQIIVFYKKKGKNSKVLMSGRVQYVNPIPEEVEGEGEGSSRKGHFDRSRDF